MQSDEWNEIREGGNQSTMRRDSVKSICSIHIRLYINFSVPLDCSLIRSLQTACFAFALLCAAIFDSLTHSLPSSRQKNDVYAIHASISCIFYLTCSDWIHAWKRGGGSMITRLIAKRVFNLFIHFGFIFADEALPPAARQSCNLHKKKEKGCYQKCTW